MGRVHTILIRKSSRRGGISKSFISKATKPIISKMMPSDNIKPLDSIYIYHITHIDNLDSIVESGGLFSQNRLVSPQKPIPIGMEEVKHRRTTRPVDCYPGTFVADYVPFYFCPRSVMLYILYKGNHPGIDYRGGQEPIIHLRAPLLRVAEWAENTGHKWCFTLANAAAGYTEFKNSLADVQEINWRAVDSMDFQDENIKEGKQAEFLVYEFFDISSFDEVGVFSAAFADRVEQSFQGLRKWPLVNVHKEWYY